MTRCCEDSLLYGERIRTSLDTVECLNVGSLRYCITALCHRTSHNTRDASNQNYFILSVHSNTGKKQISYKGAVIWREINAEYENLPFHHFKKTMCNYWLSQY